ncbi:hypothetical protein [Caulobacter sp.]
MGAKWGDTSIRGNRALGSGIISDEQGEVLATLHGDLETILA